MPVNVAISDDIHRLLKLLAYFTDVLEGHLKNNVEEIEKAGVKYE
ncbi:MAG: hypothetical protein ACXAEU_25210 [Candidatus Hodarchaeales archaeon]|jgi:hypothetical protein